jgi:hypothetical protein
MADRLVATSPRARGPPPATAPQGAASQEPAAKAVNDNVLALRARISEPRLVITWAPGQHSTSSITKLDSRSTLCNFGFAIFGCP